MKNSDNQDARATIISKKESAERSARVLKMRRDGKTFREISLEIGRHHERARQIYYKADRDQKRKERIESKPIATPIDNSQGVEMDSFIFDSFSTRVENCLKNEGIKTMDEIRGKTWRDLARIPNFGYKCMLEIHEVCGIEKPTKSEFNNYVARVSRIS